MSDWGRWGDEIECPWCGHFQSDSWEYNGHDGRKIECESCEKQMRLSVDFEVRYATDKVEENQAKSAQQNNHSCDPQDAEKR